MKSVLEMNDLIESEAFARVDTYRAFDYLWSVWYYMGIQPLRQVNQMKIKYYLLHAIFINLSVTLLFPTTLLANLFFSQNKAQLFENLVISVTDLNANFKFIYIWFVRTKLLRIKPILQYLDARAQTTEECEILKNAVRTARGTFLSFGFLFCVGTFLSGLKVYLKDEKSLLFPAWFYLDWQHSNYKYAIVLVYQFLGLIVQAIQNCANDAYPASYLCILTAHMRTLEQRIRRLGGAQQKEYFTENELEYNYKKLLICIKDHKKILQ